MIYQEESLIVSKKKIKMVENILIVLNTIEKKKFVKENLTPLVQDIKVVKIGIIKNNHVKIVKILTVKILITVKKKKYQMIGKIIV